MEFKTKKDLINYIRGYLRHVDTKPFIADDPMTYDSFVCYSADENGNKVVPTDVLIAEDYFEIEGKITKYEDASIKDLCFIASQMANNIANTVYEEAEDLKQCSKNNKKAFRESLLGITNIIHQCGTGVCDIIVHRTNENEYFINLSDTIGENGRLDGRCVIGHRMNCDSLFGIPCVCIAVYIEEREIEYGILHALVVDANGKDVRKYDDSEIKNFLTKDIRKSPFIDANLSMYCCDATFVQSLVERFKKYKSSPSILISPDML